MQHLQEQQQNAEDLQKFTTATGETKQKETEEIAAYAQKSKGKTDTQK